MAAALALPIDVKLPSGRLNLSVSRWCFPTIIPAYNREASALNRRVDFGASLTPAAKVAVTPAATTPVPAAAAPPPLMSVDDCGPEFNRAFRDNTIRFIGSSSVVDDAYTDDIDRIANLMLGCPTHTLAIGGHTDRRGAPAFNRTLSEERANAVRDALIDRNVPESRISATGYAGQRPFDPDNNRAAYALNRRVDFGVAVQPAKK